MRFRNVITIFLFLLNSCGWKSEKVKPVEYSTFTELSRSELDDMPRLEAWKKAVPAVKIIKITSSFDGKSQPALYYNSGTGKKKPLLVVLHSWSADWKQHFSIPYGKWAVINDWVFIHPHARGKYDNPQSAASETAVSDIMDSVKYALRDAQIDENRIYLTGFSGGAMTALVMAGRQPDIWAGVVAWVPVYDLALWYKQTANSHHDYSGLIEKTLGGAPEKGSTAEEEALRRSPITYLRNAKGKKINIYIASGIHDTFVPPGHSLMAFNDLADEEDRFSPEEIKHIEEKEELPEYMKGKYRDLFYEKAGVTLLYERKSSNAVIKIFDGTHDVIYNAGLFWLSEQRRQ